MTCIARFSARSPPRLSRCRTVWPLLAGIGPVPPSAAQRGERGLIAAPAGMGEAHDGLRGADRPDPVAADKAGGDVLDDGQQLGMVVLALVPGLAERDREAADLGMADGVLAAGIGGQLAPGQGGKRPLGEGVAGARRSVSSPASSRARSRAACAVRATRI